MNARAAMHCCVLCLASAGAAELRTRDGVTLRVDAAGRSWALSLPGLPEAPAPRGEYGFFLRDFRSGELSPVRLPVRRRAGALAQAGRLDAAGLAFEASVRAAGDHLAFQGRVADLSRRGDRAVDVIFRIPFAPPGGAQWRRDLYSSPPLSTPRRRSVGSPLTVARLDRCRGRRFRVFMPARGGCPQRPSLLWIAELEAYGRDQNENLLRSDRLAGLRCDSSLPSYSLDRVNDGRRNDAWDPDWRRRAWASANTPTAHWVEFEFDREVELARVDVYWSRERFGYASPRRWRLERWDGRRWVEVSARFDSRPAPPGDAEKAAFVQPGNAWATEIYPFACVTDRGGRAGLALAIPPDAPCAFRFEYDAKRRALVLTFKFGLSERPRNPALKSAAPFRFALYRVDGRWGFRDAARRYYALYPAAFRRRARLDGLWLLGDTARVIDPQHYAYHEHGASTWEIDEILGIYTCPYVLVGQREFETDASNYADAAARLRRLDPTRRSFYGPGLKAVIQNCALFRPDGRYVVRFRRRGGSVNGPSVATFPMNPDPSLFEDAPRPTVGRNTLAYVADLFRLYPGIDGIYVDSLAAWGAYKNARREHFAYVDLPLTHDQQGRVVIDNALAHIEFLRALRKRLPSQEKIIFGNGIRPGRAWAAFECDVLGVEANPSVYRSPAQYAFFRTVAKTKPFLLLYYYNYPKKDLPRAAVEEYVQSAVAFGIAPETRPPGKCRERDLDLYDTFIPILRQLGQAGWEPVTSARAEPAGLWLERFGDGRKGLFFTLYNPSDKPVAARVRFELDALPLARGKPRRELVTGAALPAEGDARLTLGPKTLRVVQIGDAPEPPAPPRVSEQDLVRRVLALREQRGSLLRNWSFEEISAYSRPKRWSVHVGGRGKLRVESRGARDGERCVHLVDPDAQSWAEVAQAFPYVEPGRRYELTVWVRQAPGAAAPGRLYYQWRGVKGRIKQGRFNFPRSTSWMQARFSLVAPSGARAVTIALGCSKAERSELWIDAARLRRVPR